ncbi:MAG: TolC family protein [Acetobacter sp.]|nr:TolC family protein [Acetobacter sp.]MBO6084934.1 TolC family protein [Acetobacter sp.]MBQ5469048.1 TolC family protein [Acetobacter sp.]MBQ5479563.1 TolC family protein [Acetobacter sp.]MBQ5515602.1 TolC family protein [Acetobacter sp.]
MNYEIGGGKTNGNRLVFLVVAFACTIYLNLIVFSSHVSAMTLHEAIEDAWKRDPVHISYEVNAEAQHQNALAARSWFPGGPQLFGQYWDDHFIGSKVGFTTYMGGVNFPLWLPGQRGATQRAAQESEKVALWQIKVQRLTLAVNIIDLTRAAEIAQDRVENLEKVRDILARSVVDIKKACDSGEEPRADYNMTVSEQENVQEALSDAQQTLENTRIELESLTGHRDVPNMDNVDGRTLARWGMQLDINKDPRFQLVTAILNKAKAAYNLARHSYVPNPEVGLMVARLIQWETPSDTQTGVQFQIDLPNKAVFVPQMMQATQAVSDAEREVVLAQRKIRVEYEQLANELKRTIEMAQHARMSQHHAAQRAMYLEEAWKVGEMPVIEYVRARRMELEATDKFIEADVTMRAAIARMVLMTGHVP